MDISASFEGKMTWELSGSGEAGQDKVRSKINDKSEIPLIFRGKRIGQLYVWDPTVLSDNECFSSTFISAISSAITTSPVSWR